MAIKTVTAPTVGDLIKLNVNEIFIHDNYRHGYTDAHEAYSGEINKIKKSILQYGFFKSKPIEVYSQDGQWIVQEGHNRLIACQTIVAEDPEFQFIEDAEPCEVWAIVVPLIENVAELHLRQFKSNIAVRSTFIDLAKLQSQLNKDLTETIPNKKARQAHICRELGIPPANLSKYEKLLKLPPELLSWLHELDLDDSGESLKPSIHSIVFISSKYGDRAWIAVLSEIKNQYEENSELYKEKFGLGFGDKVISYFVKALGFESKEEQNIKKEKEKKPAIELTQYRDDFGFSLEEEPLPEHEERVNAIADSIIPNPDKIAPSEKTSRFDVPKEISSISTIGEAIEAARRASVDLIRKIMILADYFEDYSPNGEHYVSLSLPTDEYLEILSLIKVLKNPEERKIEEPIIEKIENYNDEDISSLM